MVLAVAFWSFIMAVPKKKTSPSRRNMRRSHHGLKPVGVVDCPTCGDWKLPHHLCRSCGHYGGRPISSVPSAPEADSNEENTPSVVS